MKKQLSIPEHVVYSTAYPTGETGIDTTYRVGQKGQKPRPLVVRFLSHQGRNIVFSYTRNLKQTPFSVSEQFPPTVRERRSVQIPMLIKLRNEAKANKEDTSIKLSADKLLVNSKQNLQAFQNNPLNTVNSADQPISFHIIHSTVTEVRKSKFQGHILPIHTVDEGVKAVRAMLQDRDCVQSDHIMYAYKLLDENGQTLSGYYDDKEWKGASVLANIIEEKDLCCFILIVTRKYGGINLGKRRFELIKKVACEAIDLLNYN